MKFFLETEHISQPNFHYEADRPHFHPLAFV